MIKTTMSAAEAPTAATTATATATPEAGPSAVEEDERSVAHEASDAERVPEHIEQLAVEIGVREAGSAGVRCEVYLGAHYDSVPAGPGANDNASGTALLLEVARVHRADRVCVVAFGAEEIGLFGSRTFVDEHDVSGARLMLNFDMAGAAGWADQRGRCGPDARDPGGTGGGGRVSD